MWWNSSRHSRVSILGETCDIVGNMSYVGRLEVMGRVKGDVVVSGMVVIGCAGFCTGTIKADALEIHGTVHGDVKTTVLKLTSNAQLIGNAVYQKIVMAEGATFIKVLPEGEKLPEASLDTYTPLKVINRLSAEPLLVHKEKLVEVNKKSTTGANKKPSFQTVF